MPSSTIMDLKNCEEFDLRELKYDEQVEAVSEIPDVFVVNAVELAAQPSAEVAVVDLNDTESMSR